MQIEFLVASDSIVYLLAAVSISMWEQLCTQVEEPAVIIERGLCESSGVQVQCRSPRSWSFSVRVETR